MSGELNGRPHPRALRAVAAIIREDGWTCEAHEPDPDCSQCATLHAETARQILAAPEVHATVRDQVLAEEIARLGRWAGKTDDWQSGWNAVVHELREQIGNYVWPDGDHS